MKINKTFGGSYKIKLVVISHYWQTFAGLVWRYLVDECGVILNHIHYLYK